MHKINKYLILFFISFPSLNFLAEDLSLIVEGVGVSKANAIADAQRNALRISYGEFISTNLITLNNELTKEETVNLVSGTIKSYKVLSESVNDFSDPPITEVLVQITINKGQLISFAKAIGDSVEVRGSLYGAELELQEINEKNEAVAMQHLVKKAEIMSDLFDYKISVGDPKKASNMQNSFFIYSSISLSPNKNFKNLMNSITETLSSIALTPDEIAKYKEFNIPFHRLDVLKVIQPNCEDYLGRGRRMNGSPFMNIGDYPNLVYERHIYTDSLKGLNIVNFIEPDKWYKRKKAISKIKGIRVLGHTSDSTSSRWGYILTCTAAEVDSFFLRSNISIQSLEEINDLINKNIIEYHFYRETKQGKKLMLPFPFDDLSFFPNRDYYPSGASLYKSSTEKFDKLLVKMVRENAKGDNVLTLAELNKQEIMEDYFFDDCSKNYLCYKDTNFPEYALDINRLYSNRCHRTEPYVYSYNNRCELLLQAVGLEIDEGIFWDDRYWFRDGAPNREPGKHKAKSVIAYQNKMHGLYTEMRKKYSKTISEANSILYEGTLSLPDDTKQLFAQLIIYPVESSYARVNYEDVVTKNELSKITGYSVEVE